MRDAAASLWKMPPLAKIYEALGAIGDGRVRLEDERRASVVSSDGARTYLVETTPGTHEIFSNDNASFWQGYLGYPAIAVMIARGLYQPREDVITALTGIPWKKWNTRFRNDYSRTLAEVMRQARERGFDPKVIAAEAETVMAAVREYAPVRGPRRRPPRAAKE